MKLQLTETIEREVEITFPCYRKDGMWVVKVMGEDEFIQVKAISYRDGDVEYFLVHTKNKYASISHFFQKDYVEASEEEFETMLRETKRRLLADVNAQIFQQEKAA